MPDGDFETLQTALALMRNCKKLSSCSLRTIGAKLGLTRYQSRDLDHTLLWH